MIVNRILAGKVIPFLGAGVNSCGRPEGMAWQPGEYLPVGTELADYLAGRYPYPSALPRELLRVSQFVSLYAGLEDLYSDLRTVLDVDYPPTPLHRFLAGLPRKLRDKGHPEAANQLIVTTNYDDVLERSFRDADEPFDLVSYIAEGQNKGRFWHFPSAATEPILIEVPNEYTGLSTERTIILKIHGAVDRSDHADDSYVITEDHYIDYLTHTDLNSLIPVTLARRLQKAHFLFLGYSLRDWNLRVILHRIAQSRIRPGASWAIMRSPELIDSKFWASRNVEILNVGLEDCIAALETRIEHPEQAGVAR